MFFFSFKAIVSILFFHEKVLVKLGPDTVRRTVGQCSQQKIAITGPTWPFHLNGKGSQKFGTCKPNWEIFETKLGVATFARSAVFLNIVQKGGRSNPCSKNMLQILYDFKGILAT